MSYDSKSPVEQHEAAPADCTVDDLATLARRLAHSLRKASPSNTLANQAVDYLSRHGLAGNRLRVEAQPGSPHFDGAEAYEAHLDSTDAQPEPPAADERTAFEAKFPMPPDCIWTGKGYSQTRHDAWRAQAYARMWEGWIARASLPNAAGAEGAEEPTEFEQVIACLGDDAATLRHSDEYVEMADNMEAAARLLESLAEDRAAEAMCNRWPWERAPAQAAEPVAAGMFVKRSMFGPWIEVDKPEPGVVRHYAALPPPAPASALVDVEAMLIACVPGGDIVDPQLVCDNIREWFDENREQASASVGLTELEYEKVRLGLTAAKHFIANGVELGFIRMPDVDCPDPAHNTPKLVDEALALLEGAKHE
ncbi:hypothetical protein [Burkholderia contaminans]|uniref:hypothetical protein n=1 Tax=Burkholderia contaminans TaxID=488447 RepID=UPI001452CE53|nr:hypothetical protein [Burkholderia contaminans]VWD20230.1 hypothetical protein BCO18442_03862 [Burkholderia contaminans]